MVVQNTEYNRAQLQWWSWLLSINHGGDARRS